MAVLSTIHRWDFLPSVVNPRLKLDIDFAK